MKKSFVLLIILFSAFLSVLCSHAALLGVQLSTTKHVNSFNLYGQSSTPKISSGSTFNNNSSNYMYFTEGEGVTFDLGTQRNLSQLEIKLAATSDMAIILQVKFFSGIDGSRGTGEIITLYQRHSISPSVSFFRTYDHCCRVTVSGNNYSYISDSTYRHNAVIKNVRCIEISLVGRSVATNVNIYQVRAYRRSNPTDTVYQDDMSTIVDGWYANFANTIGTPSTDISDRNAPQTITYCYRDRDELPCFWRGGRPTTDTSSSYYYTIDSGAEYLDIFSTYIVITEDPYVTQDRLIITTIKPGGTAKVTFYRKESRWHEACQVTYTFHTVARDINSTQIEASYHNPLIYNGEAQTPTVSVTDTYTTDESVYGTPSFDANLTETSHYTVAYENNKNVGTDTMKITVAGDGFWYIGSRTFTATILPKPVTPVVHAIDKTYDGNTTASGSVTLSGVIDGETATASAGSYTFDSKNAGEREVLAEGITISGTHAKNYTFGDPLAGTNTATTSATGNATITPMAITVTVNADDKTYDGNTTATGSVHLNDVILGDTITATASSYTFAQKDVGTDIPVTASAITTDGADSANYTVPTSGTGAADILAKTLTPTLYAKDKVYNGTTSVLASLSLSGIEDGDAVSISASSITFDNKNVGTGKTVTAIGLKINNENYTLSTDTATTTASITPKTIIPHATANNKTYDTTTAISEGTLYLEGIIDTDMVELQAASFAFDSALPGNRNAVAKKLSLIGTDKDNYVLKTDTCSVPASISPYGTITASCVSPEINTATATLMQTAVQNVLPFTLPDGCTYTYTEGEFGAATTDYARTGEFIDALGKITDTFSLNILIDGITVVYGNINVTTGTNTVYGDNQYTEGELLSSSILKFDTPWTTDASHNASIETATPTDVTFYVYLRQGEKLNVGTKIGLYYGRVDVTVKKGESEQAKDYIDAFFPVSYKEEYTISNMHSSVVQDTINPSRGDYWNAVPEFVADTDGLYNVTMHITGSSYLLDAQKGLGTQYAGNDPADPPETSLRYVSIQ